MRPTWLALAVMAAALPPAAPATAAMMIPPPPWRAKEFAILKHQDQFHLFYMRRDENLPVDGAFRDLGHATSYDLMSWTQHDGVIPVRPYNWDNREIWAPHVVEKDGVFYMFYSSVTHDPPAVDLHQRIGLAISTDLFNWQRFDEPVFECADVPWTYCDPTTPVGGEFRDPFVIPDPAAPGEFLMYYVARDDVDRNQYLMGAGRSTGDLAVWSSAASFANLHRAKTGSFIIENPALLEHDGLWYLFYTTWNQHPIQYQAGTDPLGAPGTWGPAISLYDEVGWSRTDTWFGPEVFSDGGIDYFLAVESDFFWVEIQQIDWEPGGGFRFVDVNVDSRPTPPPPPAEWRLTCELTSPRWDRLPIAIEAPEAVDARVELVDVTGRVRRTLFADRLAAGTNRLAWDGRDGQGDPVGSGVYFLRLRAGVVEIARKVARLR